MTDEAVAAEAAPEPVVAPEVQEAPRNEPTPRNAIDRAFEALELQDKDTSEPVGAEGDEPKGDRERNADGTFKAKTDTPAENKAEKAPDKPQDGDKTKEAAKDTAEKPATFGEAPSRFSADAKAAWANAPEPVRAEIHRAVSELEKGIQQYKSEFDPLKPYVEMAKQHNTSVPKALDNYINLERTLMSDPERGMQMVADYAGIDLRAFAAKLAGQTLDEAASKTDQVIRELNSKIANLEQQLGGVSTTIQEQRHQGVLSQVEAFAADHPRFEELATDIEFFIKSGRTQDLQEAYELAERLNPAPQAPAPAAPAAPQPDRAAQTRKGSLSVTGAPSSGSDPAIRKPPSSAREAIDHAFASIGLG